MDTVGAVDIYVHALTTFFTIIFHSSSLLENMWNWEMRNEKRLTPTAKRTKTHGAHVNLKSVCVSARHSDGKCQTDGQMSWIDVRNITYFSRQTRPIFTFKFRQRMQTKRKSLINVTIVKSSQMCVQDVYCRGVTVVTAISHHFQNWFRKKR